MNSSLSIDEFTVHLDLHQVDCHRRHLRDRSAFAMLASISRSSNFGMSSLISRIFTFGNRRF